MIVTDDLIERLAADLKPVRKGTVPVRLTLGAAGGALVSLLLISVTLGLRPDMAQAATLSMFWIKLLYTFCVAALALATGERLTRPGIAAGTRLWWLALPLVLMGGLALWHLAETAPDLRLAQAMGHTALVCPWLIIAFAVPPFLGLAWAARGLAPTRLKFTGLVLGLAAGGASASAYALHCDEMAAPFLAVWYTAGVAGAGLLGYLAGPRLMRW